METPPASRESILQQLAKVLASETFSGARRSQDLLRFLVERALDDQLDRLKEYTLGSEALGRGDSFDPRTDPIVRAEASRLRSRLERYYAGEGVADTVVITLPKGSYAPQFRYRDVVDDGPAPAGGPAPPPNRAQRLVWFAWGGLTVSAVLAVAIWVWSRAAPTRDAEVLEFDVELARGDHSLGSDFGPDVALSPDGNRLVFVARGPDGLLRLMTRRIGQTDTVQLPETEGARAPFFSPDGKWVGFWAAPKLKKTSVGGGSPIELGDAVDFGGASWAEDGHIIAALGRTLVRMPSSPGDPTLLIDLAEDGISPRWPQLLPGGRHVLFTAIGPAGPNAASIEALAVSGGTRTPVLQGGSFARYLGNGCLVYVNQGTLFAVPFDVARLAPRGAPVPVREGISYASTFGFAQLDVSRTGTLVYRRSTARGRRVVSLIHQSGKIEALLVKPGEYFFPRLSPDGGLLALGVAEGGSLATLAYDPQQDRTTRLPAANGLMSGIWSPDGRFLVLASMKGMYWARADDPSKLEPLTRNSTVQIPWSFTADGTRLAYHELGRATAFDLWTIPIQATADRLRAGEPQVFLQTPFYETYPAFSPDGRWVSYGSGEYGTWEVYVRPFPPGATKEIRVSAGGGRISRWLPGSRELIYRTDDHRLMVVGYEVKNGSFVAGKPREWARQRLADTGVLGNFDLHPDGRQVIALLPADGDEDLRVRNQVTVVLNFSDDVRRRVSGGPQ